MLHYSELLEFIFSDFCCFFSAVWISSSIRKKEVFCAAFTLTSSSSFYFVASSCYVLNNSSASLSKEVQVFSLSYNAWLGEATVLFYCLIYSFISAIFTKLSFSFSLSDLFCFFRVAISLLSYFSIDFRISISELKAMF